MRAPPLFFRGVRTVHSFRNHIFEAFIKIAVRILFIVFIYYFILFIFLYNYGEVIQRNIFHFTHVHTSSPFKVLFFLIEIKIMHRKFLILIYIYVQFLFLN